MNFQTVNINELKVVNEKPVLSIEEHSTILFAEEQKDKLVLEESDDKQIEYLERKNVTVDDVHKGIKISTGFYVGAIEFNRFILNVLPKFTNFDNLGRMMAFCYIEKVDFPDFEEIRFLESVNHPMEFLMIAFERLCQKLIRRGLYRSYVTYNDDVSYMKGKLMIKQQILNTMKFNMKFNCEYDEFTSNNIENQIILHTLKKCKLITKQSELKTKIEKLIHQIDREIEDEVITLDDFKKIGFTSLNQNYQDPLVLAKLIIANIGMFNLREMKTKFIIPFFVHMPDMYEKFLEKLFLAKQWYPLVTKRQNPSHPWLKDGKQEKEMRPDLVTYKGGLQNENIVSVIDAKYMEDIKEGERYQIAFYLNEYHKQLAYAICCTTKQTIVNDYYQDKDTYTLTVPNQDIAIKVKHINIDEILERIFSEDKSNLDVEMREILTKIVPVTQESD